MGRPLRFKTSEELDFMVDMYVDEQKADNRPLSIPGLCLYLGFSDKSSFYDYEKREVFSHSIKRARTIIEVTVVDSIMLGGGAGPIFMAKNMGYTDKHTVSFDPINIVLTDQQARL
jgi:hypothetical protein